MIQLVHDYLLRALLSCGHCNLTMAGRTRGTHTYYVCKGKGPAIWSRREKKCPARSISVAQLDDLVWRDLCDVLQHPESLRAMGWSELTAVIGRPKLRE
jgi:site-specific DNA recombinase